jgi:hypothetical protein
MQQPTVIKHITSYLYPAILAAISDLDRIYFKRDNNLVENFDDYLKRSIEGKKDKKDPLEIKLGKPVKLGVDFKCILYEIFMQMVEEQTLLVETVIRQMPLLAIDAQSREIIEKMELNESDKIRKLSSKLDDIRCDYLADECEKVVETTSFTYFARQIGKRVKLTGTTLATYNQNNKVFESMFDEALSGIRSIMNSEYKKALSSIYENFLKAIAAIVAKTTWLGPKMINKAFFIEIVFVHHDVNYELIQSLLNLIEREKKAKAKAKPNPNVVEIPKLSMLQLEDILEEGVPNS